MNATTTANDRRRRDWLIILLIILIGFLCLLLAGFLALRTSPNWQLSADMDSKLDPNSDFLTLRPIGFIEPVDSSILTPPLWVNLFLTPGAIYPTRQPSSTPTASTPVIPSETSTSAKVPATVTPTRTFIYIPPTSTQVSNPVATRTAPANTTSTATRTPTATLSQTKTPTSTHTATTTPTTTKTPTSTYTPTDTSTATYTPTYTATATATSASPSDADLQITKSDGTAFYMPGATLTYTVRVTNNGPAMANGAIVTDNIPPQVASWSWSCAASGGASGCSPVSNSTTDFTNTVNLPSGATITYTVTAIVSNAATGDLINRASIDPPSGITDPTLLNNSANDTDQILIPFAFPNGNIGSNKDSNTDVLDPGSSLTFAFNSPVTVGGHSGYDLVYYEMPNDTGIAMDTVILQIGDGSTWYTIFNWGDGIADTNSNLNIDVIGGRENDNRNFTTAPDSDILYDSTGVLIELDGFVPNGTYPFLRIISPSPDDGDGCEVDAIVVLP